MYTLAYIALACSSTIRTVTVPVKRPIPLDGQPNYFMVVVGKVRVDCKRTLPRAVSGFIPLNLALNLHSIATSFRDCLFFAIGNRVETLIWFENQLVNVDGIHIHAQTHTTECCPRDLYLRFALTSRTSSDT